jgi:hypothetical protein
MWRDDNRHGTPGSEEADCPALGGSATWRNFRRANDDRITTRRLGLREQRTFQLGVDNNGSHSKGGGELVDGRSKHGFDFCPSGTGNSLQRRDIGRDEDPEGDSPRRSDNGHKRAWIGDPQRHRDRSVNVSIGL